jgi:hypothetical protein
MVDYCAVACLVTSGSNGPLVEFLGTGLSTTAGFAWMSPDFGEII